MKRFRSIIGAVPILLVMACGGTAEQPPEPAGDPGDDPRPLTREQIEESVEAMSPAQAESLGIVDTTIRIESPMPEDSVIRVLPDSTPENR